MFLLLLLLPTAHAHVEILEDNFEMRETKGNHHNYAPKLSVLYTARTTGSHRTKQLSLLQWLQLLRDGRIINLVNSSTELLYIFGLNSSTTDTVRPLLPFT